jgi:hypothetical protein
MKILPFVNGKLGAVPWFRSLNLYFSPLEISIVTVGARESSSEAMTYQWTSLSLCLVIKENSFSRPYTAVSKLAIVGTFREVAQPQP